MYKRLRSILLRQAGVCSSSSSSSRRRLTFMAINRSRQRVWCACSSSVIRKNRSSEGRSKWFFFTLCMCESRIDDSVQATHYNTKPLTLACFATQALMLWSERTAKMQVEEQIHVCEYFAWRNVRGLGFSFRVGSRYQA